MKVKIGDKVYDPEKQPIMIILSEKDKENIANMSETATKYCCFPNKGYTEEEINEFMNITEDKNESKNTHF
jgi:hypothetical protein